MAATDSLRGLAALFARFIEGNVILGKGRSTEQLCPARLIVPSQTKLLFFFYMFRAYLYDVHISFNHLKIVS